ncbi:MAG: helix-turn-helix domain-containing protein [Lentisphaerae bacterium]|nr:helix-turn-helix domain-containing protein [Lentisphaerota bacterium]
MKSQQISLKLFLKHPDFPVAVVPVKTNEPSIPDFTSIPHYHDFLELVIVTGGSGIQWINGNEYPVSAGDVFVLQGNDKHYFSKIGKNLTLFNILYDQEKLPLPLKFFKKLNNYNMIFRVEPALRKNQDFISRIHLEAVELAVLEKQVRSLEQIINCAEEGFEVETVTLLTTLILNLCRRCKNHSGDNAQLILTERMNKVISLMERNFTVSYTVAELAHRMHTSPRNFTRLFNKVIGRSPIEYLCEIRLRHAAELLITTDLSCGDIAWQSGFNDSNYFSRKFSSRYGLSPREYRKLK